MNPQAPNPQVQAFLASKGYTPPAGSKTGGWYSQITAPKAAKPSNPIAEQFNQGVQQVKQAGSDIFSGKENPIQAAESGLSAESGVATAITAPLAPVMKPVSNVINWLGEKIGGTQAAQDFVTKHPDAAATLERLATDASNAGNVAGTITGAEGIAKGVPKAVDATKSAVESIKPKPPTPEVTAATQKATAAKVHDIIDKEVRNTAEKYPTVGTALNNAEVGRGSEPIKVMSSYPEGKALPQMSKAGKMNSIPAINFLKDQISRLGEIKSNLVGTAKDSVPLEDFKQAAFDRIDKGSASLTKKAADKADVAKIIDDMNKDYPNGIPTTELDKIKTEQANESKSYNSKSAFSADSHAIVGQTAADAVISKGGEAPIDELNKLLSSHYDAIKVLKAMNGKTPHGGMFSKHLGGIAGEVAGLAGGMAVGHPFIGAMVGRGASEFVNNVLSNHFISNPLKASLIKGMKGEDPAVIQKALDYIKSSESSSLESTPTESTPQSSQGEPGTTSQ